MGTRASNGRSSIYRGEDASWHGRVTMGFGPDGRPDRRHVRGRTKADVARKVADLEKRRATGTGGDPGRPPTVEAWLRHWLVNIAAPRVRPKTLMGYETDVRLHAIPALGAHRLDRIQPEHVEVLYASLIRLGRSPATVQHVKATLNSAFGEAVARGRMIRNPITRASAPRMTAMEIEPLTAADARRIMDVAADQRNGSAWTVSLSLGMRRGEVLALRWNDIDLDAETVSVRRAAQRLPWKHGCPDPHACGAKSHKTDPCSQSCTNHKANKRGCPPPCPADCTGHASHCPMRTGGGIVTGEPKSAAGKRTLALPAPLVALLRAHRKEQAAEQLLAGNCWTGTNLVFCQPNGNPIDPDGHSRAWKALLERAGIREARLHDARHTAATLLLVQGVDARTVMDLMGWSQVSMTQRYQHVVPELRNAAAARMAEVLWGASNPSAIITTSRTSRGDSRTP
jgi:integrase